MGKLKGYIKSEDAIMAFHELLEKSFPSQATPLKYEYFDVLDENADSRDTMVEVVSKLYHEFSIGKSKSHLIVVGDAKTYQHLQNIKIYYGEKLSWLLPFPGDFHILMNYQPVLSKVYFDVALKQVASMCGFKGETLTSLQKCSHFKKTHYFIMEAWEALYLDMLESFLQQNKEAENKLSELVALFDPKKLPSILEQCKKPLVELQTLFNEYALSKEGPNWRFWLQFVQINCFSYIALFCAIRSGNWNLRLASIKTMAPVFSAFDRPTYRKVIPQHLADCILLPADIRHCFELGGFSASITGRPWHLVALDELHEMLINKDCKDAVIHPTKEFISRQSLYFPFRSAVLHNIKEQVQLSSESDYNSSEAATTNRNLKASENAEAMKKCISANNVLPVDNASDSNLRNPFSGKTASPAQQIDLLTFRDVGQSDFDTFVQHKYLCTSSVTPIARQHRLKTFANRKVTKRSMSNVQKEKNVVTKCLRSRLLWAQVHGGTTESPEQQYLELPRAIADANGIPNKGQKSNTTSYYSKRYGNHAFSTSFPPGWLPDIVILEGMFMINTTPLRIHAKMSDYITHLLSRYAGCYLNMGVTELHIIFDDAGRFGVNPKRIEQARRDASISTTNSDHEHSVFSDDMKIPSKWREILECRKCKRQLVVYMGESLLQHAHEFLRGDQKLYVAGTGEEEDQDTVWYTTRDGIEHPDPAYKCAAEEGDTRVWLHVVRSPGRKKLVYSPDTDVYHIGLTNVDLTSQEVIVQLSKIGTSLKLFHMNKFFEAIGTDPDLSSIPLAHRPQVLQILYIAPGCDFTSFFVGIGKVAFLKSFYQYAKFITAQPPQDTMGSLIHINPNRNGFLSFLRLVGVAYFQKNRGAFEDDNPISFFNSITDPSLQEKHTKWYNEIRAKVWPRISFEDSLPPSHEALHLHWLRTTWVADYWSQATQTNMILLPLDAFGWKTQGTDISVEWDSPDNIEKVRNRVAFLLHGCKCKTGCGTLRCKCLKASRPCGPGCSCLQCQNMPQEGKNG